MRLDTGWEQGRRGGRMERREEDGAGDGEEGGVGDQ